MQSTSDQIQLFFEANGGNSIISIEQGVKLGQHSPTLLVKTKKSTIAVIVTDDSWTYGEITSTVSYCTMKNVAVLIVARLTKDASDLIADYRPHTGKQIRLSKTELYISWLMVEKMLWWDVMNECFIKWAVAQYREPKEQGQSWENRPKLNPYLKTVVSQSSPNLNEFRVSMLPNFSVSEANFVIPNRLMLVP